MIRKKLWLGLVSAVLLACSSRANEPKPNPLNSEQDKQVGRLLASLRGAKTPVARRAALVKQLVTFGPAAVARTEKLLTEEIDRVAKAAGELKPDSTYDAEIARLRKTLADLRADEGLTEEKVTSIGDPAADQLKKLFTARLLADQPRQAKLVELCNQLASMSALFKALNAVDIDAELSGAKSAAAAIDTAPLQKRIDEVLTSIAPPPEELAAHEVLAANVELLAKIDEQEAKGVQMLNEMRIVFGLRPLLVDLKLCDAARGHSADMATHNFFAHESPVPGKKSFTDRAVLAKTTASGENIYMGSTSAAAAISGWFHSPGHHKNMFADHVRVGHGRAGEHWTEMFGN